MLAKSKFISCFKHNSFVLWAAFVVHLSLHNSSLRAKVTWSGTITTTNSHNFDEGSTWKG